MGEGVFVLKENEGKRKVKISIEKMVLHVKGRKRTTETHVVSSPP